MKKVFAFSTPTLVVTISLIASCVILTFAYQQSKLARTSLKGITQQANNQLKSEQTPASISAIQESPFPTELLMRPKRLDGWIAPVLLTPKPNCLTNPENSLSSEVVNPDCPVWKEAIVSTDPTIKAEVVPVRGTTGRLRFRKNGQTLVTPPLKIEASASVAVSFLKENEILVDLSGYEWRRQMRLLNGSWTEVQTPEPVQAAYPWLEKPPFHLVLGRTQDKYIETRWPPAGTGYFGNDPQRSVWALVYIVDRKTGQVVAEEAEPRGE